MRYGTEKIIGATRLNNDELLITYSKYTDGKRKSYFKILKYNGSTITDGQVLDSPNAYSLVPLTNNAVIGYYSSGTNYSTVLFTK